MSTSNASDPKVKQDIEENKVVAAIGYISILCIIPLFLKPKSAYCKFHGKQGLLLFIIGIVNSFLFFIPPICVLVSIGLVVFSILGILKALNGEYWEMPYIGEYARKINI